MQPIIFREGIDIREKSGEGTSVIEIGSCWNFPGGPVVTNSPSSAVVSGSIPCRGPKVPHASWWPKNQNTKQKQNCNKFNKDFKNGSHQKVFKKKKVGELSMQWAFALQRRKILDSTFGR